MARQPRYAVAGFPQHVIQRGNNRSAMFVHTREYEFFHECLVAAAKQHSCQIHAYVLMTNHVHLVLTPQTPGAVGKLMQLVGRRYVWRFNRAHARTGTLWEGRYRATLIDSEAYLLACYSYVELNPVRAGMCARPAAYRWSSHRANAFGRLDPLVTTHPSYEALGVEPKTRQAAYRALFDAAIDDETIATIRQATNGGWALGDDQFRRQVSALANRRAHPIGVRLRSRAGA
jgi:putative transposase